MPSLRDTLRKKTAAADSGTKSDRKTSPASKGSSALRRDPFAPRSSVRNDATRKSERAAPPSVRGAVPPKAKPAADSRRAAPPARPPLSTRKPAPPPPPEPEDLEEDVELPEEEFVDEEPTESEEFEDEAGESGDPDETFNALEIPEQDEEPEETRAPARKGARPARSERGAGRDAGRSASRGRRDASSKAKGKSKKPDIGALVAKFGPIVGPAILCLAIGIGIGMSMKRGGGGSGEEASNLPPATPYASASEAQNELSRGEKLYRDGSALDGEGSESKRNGMYKEAERIAERVQLTAGVPEPSMEKARTLQYKARKSETVAP